jgi:hypothetical protein
MKFICILFSVTSLISNSYAGSTELFVKPGSSSEFLHSLNGKNDPPSGYYSLTLVKLKEMDTELGRIPMYHLRANGFPIGHKFQIVNRNAIGESFVVLKGTHFGNGQILNTRGNLMTTCEWFAVGGFERGEPSEFLLLDPKQNTSKAVFFLPHPVEPAIANGMNVTMHYVNHNPPSYLFGLENLTPGEKIHVRSIAGSERIASTLIAPQSGNASAFVTHKDNPDLDASFEVQRAEGDLTIKYPSARERSNPSLPSALIIFTIDCALTVEDRDFTIAKYMEELAKS